MKTFFLSFVCVFALSVSSAEAMNSFLFDVPKPDVDCDLFELPPVTVKAPAGMAFGQVFDDALCIDGVCYPMGSYAMASPVTYTWQEPVASKSVDTSLIEDPVVVYADPVVTYSSTGGMAAFSAIPASTFTTRTVTTTSYSSTGSSVSAFGSRGLLSRIRQRRAARLQRRAARLSY
jgi:hypothetical protein